MVVRFGMKDKEAKKLISQYWKGDKKALDSLLEAIQDYTRNIVHNYYKNLRYDIRDDVAALSTLKFYDSIKTKKYSIKGQSVASYAFTVTRNEFINAYRKAKKQNLSHDIKESTAQDIGELVLRDDISIEQNIFSNEFFEKIYDVVKEIKDPKYHRVFYDKHYCNMKYDQIAKKNNLAIGTVRSILHRCKNKLQDAFSGKETELREYLTL